jgi:hypothetical protein
LHITIPSYFSALLGRLLYHRHRIPYGIDYIDPWVDEWSGSQQPFGKAWLAHRLSVVLEPWAVKSASLITGVAPLYFEDVLIRNPGLRDRVVTRAMPYGASAKDFELVRRSNSKPALFDPSDGRFHIVYAGALLPKALAVLDRLLEAMTILREDEPELFGRLRFHFIGTGRSPTDPTGHNVMPSAARLGLDQVVSEHPHRMAYPDVLTHLVYADGILILGSTERHYTPSKVYQAIQARRPIFALLHEESTAQQALKDARAGASVCLGKGELPQARHIAERLKDFVTTAWDPQSFNSSIADSTYSARRSAELLAQSLDEALAKARHARKGA